MSTREDRILESYPEVFADIANVLLFNGEQYISANSLQGGNSEPLHKYRLDLQKQERTTQKICGECDLRILSAGLANQPVDYCDDLPAKIYSYEIRDYEFQAAGNGDTVIRPVITVVLYFNRDEAWDGPNTYAEYLQDVPKELVDFLPPTKVNLFDIARLTREQVDMFQSDFRWVADYLVQTKDSDSYVPPTGTVKHMKEVLSLLAVITGDRRFEVVSSKMNQNPIATMAEAMEAVESIGDRSKWLLDMDGEYSILINATKEEVVYLFEKKVQATRDYAEKKGTNCSGIDNSFIEVDDDVVRTSFLLDAHCEDEREVCFEAKRVDSIKICDLNDMLREL